MTNKPPRKRPPRKSEGRPRKYGKAAMKHHNIRLTAKQAETARGASASGQLSDGIQKIIDRHSGLVALKHIGGKMSNLFFNLAQNEAVPPEHRETMRQMCERWDKTIKELP